MSVVFAGAMSHAPGMTVWPDAAEPHQKEDIYKGANELRKSLEKVAIDELIMFTSEHWVNFFLDHMSAMVVGRADYYPGPVEPWMKMEKVRVPGAPVLSEAILREAYASDMEPGFAHEIALDHGTIIPLSFLTPNMTTPIVPVYFNTLGDPAPEPHRCFKLGECIGRVARQSDKRIGLLATGGLTHDPGERGHGYHDADFDLKFMEQLATGDKKALCAYTAKELASYGAGTMELLNWIALSGALGDARGTVLSYHSVEKWAGGTGVMSFDVSNIG